MTADDRHEPRVGGAPRSASADQASRGDAADGLELFLRTEARQKTEQIEEIRALIDEVLDVFIRTFSDDSWPYLLANTQKLEAMTQFSYSTSAMIAFALGLTTGKIERSELAPVVETPPPSVDKELEGRRAEARAAIDDIVAKALDAVVRASDQETEDRLTASTTFGDDDPFTLAWLLDVLRAYPGEGRDAYRERLKARAWQRVRTGLDAEDGLVLQFDRKGLVSHAFPLLRVLQLGEALSKEDHSAPLSRTEDVATARNFLFQRVHYQLSESQRPAGDFDAGDLVFSLEGWMLTSPSDPDLSLVARVFDALRDSPETTPYWRPLRPFRVNPQGFVLLPQSVEIANSLLRICSHRAVDRAGWFSAQVEQLERYAQWLRGRVFRGRFEGESDGHFVGWESEHTHSGDRIHLWQTSQALIFLQHYIGMLQQHLARSSLRLAGFVVPWSDPRTVAPRPAAWEQWRGGEPLQSGDEDSPYRVYERIEAEFLAPRREPGGVRPASSMLLYGPPGTGKSTAAEKVADALGFQSITVTPSDFISAGGEAVEARAKAIFSMLHEQSGLVVVFDEIDQLLLDRDSRMYRAQSDLFKLLTPGMLTKLNDLAKRGRVIFVISTNYFERIDRAIKRAGRIDARYLVLPPDLAQRRRYLGERVDGWETLTPYVRDAAANDTVLCTYRELEDVATEIRERSTGTGEPLEKIVAETVTEFRPIITLAGYGPRLGLEWHEDEPRDTELDTVERPYEEFALLAYLELEATGVLPPRPEWLPEALRRALDDEVVMDRVIAERLRQALPE